MNSRLLSVLVFALVISAGASYLVYRLVSAQLEANSASGLTQTLVATRDLRTGDLLSEADVRLAEWGGEVPAGAITIPEEAVGRGVIEPIYAGEPILETRLAARGAGAGLAATIPAGMRAVAVRVNDVVGVAGFVTPGMKVDILISGTPPRGNGGLGSITQTLLQNVEVLSAGQNIQRDAEGKPINVSVVNVLVTPEQAEILSLATNETRIQLVLRNPTDNEEVVTPGTAVQYLYDNHGKRPVEVPPPAPRPVARAAAPGPVAAPAPRPTPIPPPPPPKREPIKVVVMHGASISEATFEPEDEQQQQISEETQQ